MPDEIVKVEAVVIDVLRGPSSSRRLTARMPSDLVAREVSAMHYSADIGRVTYYLPESGWYGQLIDELRGEQYTQAYYPYRHDKAYSIERVQVPSTLFRWAPEYYPRGFHRDEDANVFTMHKTVLAARHALGALLDDDEARASAILEAIAAARRGFQ